ncbi:uncharacterized protein LOC143831989 [Paroedura picta]|uniref:uncharacterized protein LOC143831989 n=1 Tax=Paroedura picta TaxID=143630 RepID=UPI004056C555
MEAERWLNIAWDKSQSRAVRVPWLPPPRACSSSIEVQNADDIQLFLLMIDHLLTPLDNLARCLEVMADWHKQNQRFFVVSTPPWEDITRQCGMQVVLGSSSIPATGSLIFFPTKAI